jgi:hypothetical protein
VAPPKAQDKNGKQSCEKNKKTKNDWQKNLPDINFLSCPEEI